MLYTNQLLLIIKIQYIHIHIYILYKITMTTVKLLFNK
jgi:hypothetical protein